MGGVVYRYQCDFCGHDSEAFGAAAVFAPPERILTENGYFQAGPCCAPAQKKLEQQRTEQQAMPTPEELRAAAKKLEQAQMNKARAARPPEPEPEDDYPYGQNDDQYGGGDPIDDGLSTPLHRQPVASRPAARQQRYAEPPPARSRLAEAQERYDRACDHLEKLEDALDAAEDELDEAEQALDEAKKRQEERRQRFAERRSRRPAEPERKPLRTRLAIGSLKRERQAAKPARKRTR